MKPNRNRYRAWDEKHGVMIGWDELTSPSGWNCTLGILTNPTMHHLTFLQSTGTADENDVEMYAGDIVRFVTFDFNDNDTAYIGKLVREDTVFTIHSFEKDGCFGSDGPFDLCWVHSQDDTMTVIGNIYENPELLD